MLRCVAVDDEPLALRLLTEYISKVPFLELVATCEDAFQAAKVLQENEIDLLFMDIQMPGLTGLQFIQSMPKRPMVVLITAYKKFATEGFDLDVVDYIVKPVGMDRFLKACYKAQELHQLRTGATTGAKPADYFFVNVDYSLLKVLFADIIWIEGAGDYVKIHMHGGAKPLLVRMSAKAVEAELPSDQFVRIHKSYIVSVNAITAVRKNSVFIGTMELPVSESHKDALRQITRKNF